MTVVDFTFGFEEQDMVAVKDIIEGPFGAVFELRDSFYHGGRYLFSATPHEELIIQVNEDLPGELAEDDFPNAKTLVLVDATSRPGFVMDFFIAAGATLIREDTYEK